ncbi:hypothetical protein RUND412_008319 [Rhizina undulata]
MLLWPYRCQHQRDHLWVPAASIIDEACPLLARAFQELEQIEKDIANSKNISMLNPKNNQSIRSPRHARHVELPLHLTGTKLWIQETHKD